MEEQLLIKIALSCILIGLPLLFFLSSSVEEREGIIEQDLIRFKGEIVEVEQREDVTFLSVVPSTGFRVIVFDEVNFRNGSEVTIEGRLDWYKGEMEIIGESIE